MKSIFISYARADREHAADLAQALAKSGYSVWWDWNLVGGENFRNAIGTQLDRADKVIVIWSETSNTSSFVIDEVSAARRLNKLIPTSLDGAQPPFGFGDLHTLALSTSKTDIDAIVGAIENKVTVLLPRPWYKKLGTRHILGVLAVLAAALAVASLYPQYWGAKRQTFSNPKNAAGVRIDHCLHWGRECGEPAATFWCRGQGFRTAFDHAVESNVPPTFVLGDNRICEFPQCTALKTIVCEK